MAEKVAELSSESNVEQAFKVEVTKNTKGYNWVVRVYGDDIDSVTSNVERLETWAKTKYGDA